jgi:hypothetical protein
MNVQSKIEAPPNTSVYAKIAAVQSVLAKQGISKSRKNQQQGYSFRGIDEVYAALAPLLAEHGLCVLPRILTRELIERKTAKGSPLFYVTVEAEFDFISAEDGSTHTVRTFGEAMDSADKATNKAMSAAYKYAALMAFAIPTEGDNDADSVTHEVAPQAEMPDHEWAKLVQLIEATKSDTGAMLKFYKVPDLRKLTQDQYAHAVNSLENKLAKAAKAETDAKVEEPA